MLWKCRALRIFSTIGLLKNIFKDIKMQAMSFSKRWELGQFPAFTLLFLFCYMFSRHPQCSMKGRGWFEPRLFHLIAMTLGKLFQVVEPQFPHLLNDIRNPDLITSL